MTWNVLIADDEYYIRKRLIKIIPWAKLNLTLLGEADDGQKALSYIDTGLVDIILLDIKMPLRNGIEVAHYIRQTKPDIQIIFLSGYSEFEYARKAINYKVNDYLLKPVDADVLSQSLSQITQQLVHRQENKDRLSTYQQLMITRQLNEIRNQKLPYTHLIEHYPAYQAVQYTNYIGVYSHSKKGLADFDNAVQAAALLCHPFPISPNINIYQLFYSTNQPVDLSPLQPDTDFFYFATGRLLPIADDWDSAYQESLVGLEQRYFLPSPTNSANPVISTSAHINLKEKLIYLLNSKQKSQLADYLKQLFLFIQAEHNYALLCTIATEIMNIYSSFDPLILPSDKQLMHNLLEREYRLSVIENKLLEYGLDCLNSQTKVPSDILLCHKLNHFIEQHYADSNLTVRYLAEKFNLHPSYLNSIFKKNCHNSLLHHINHIRLQHAQSLLQQPRYSIHQVAALSGFNDPFYFSRKFKSEYGITPSAYRQIHSDHVRSQ